MKCFSSCPPNCHGNLPPSLGLERPHPVKNLFEVLGIEARGYHKYVLVGLPGSPPWKDFKLMLEGLKQMPPCLELHIFRKCFGEYGSYWQVVGGSGSGKLKGRYMRSDGRLIDIQELDDTEDEQL